MIRDKMKVESALKKKGFHESPGYKHKFLRYITLSGKETQIKTHTSHSVKGKDLNPSLLMLMAKQCQLDKDDFVKLVDCYIDQPGFEKIMIEKGSI